ncbi:MAG: DUF2690 domain-containing protein [Symploca sp. SIO2D2]|nr:DUF2690 domain-containing protein [Symploca sp. SIO2D2]
MVNKKVIIGAVVLTVFGIGNTYLAWTLRGPLCYQDSCTDFDPINKKCDGDAITTVEGQFEETTIELRYSAKCDASWSRAIVPYQSSLYVEDDGGKQYGKWEVPNNGILGPSWGNMGPGRNLKACIQLPDPDDKHLCTQLAN